MLLRRIHHLFGLRIAVLLLACALFGLGACSEPAPPEVGSPCTTLADCRGDNKLICVDEACTVVGCESPSDCPLETTCIDEVCGPYQCDGPDSCEQGSRCWQGLCVENGCRQKGDCELGQICLGTPPVCTEPPPLCSSDEECPGAQGCMVHKRTCAPTCTQDADCTGQSYCLDGLCHASCRDDADCPGRLSCLGQRCQELPDCSDQPECSGLRRYRDPATCECVGCLDSAHCDLSRQEFCTSQGTCLYCPQSTTNEADCTARGGVFVEGCCTDCLEDADCTSPNAPYCNRGRCASTPGRECIGQNDCDDGKVCDRGRCVEPPSFADCAVQSDCPEGEACYADGLCHAESEVCQECPSESRCIAEPGDELGTCAGCTSLCDESACPDGRVCFVEDGAGEGYCVEASQVPACG